MNVDLGNYAQKGLYLLFGDSSIISLTESNIERTAREFWDDPNKIPIHVRKAADFQLCGICPEKGNEGICYSLHPVLPFLELIDQYFSFDKVTAFYREDEEGLLYISETAMQNALQYISILSLLSYCRVGRKYWKYYYGVIPIMGADAAVNRFYLNIYWLHEGKMNEINKFISEFKENISIISENVIKRLNLICQRDAFINAFFNTHVFAEFLSMDMEEVLKKTFCDLDNTPVQYRSSYSPRYR
ncbi:MAG: hypothetical protein ABSA46_00110 [Thermodesulfovibrionales bacterium]|jgi:hypothetical protein